MYTNSTGILICNLCFISFLNAFLDYIIFVLMPTVTDMTKTYTSKLRHTSRFALSICMRFSRCLTTHGVTLSRVTEKAQIDVHILSKNARQKIYSLQPNIFQYLSVTYLPAFRCFVWILESSSKLLTNQQFNLQYIYNQYLLYCD